VASDTPKPSESILSQKSPADALNVVAALLDSFDARLTILEGRDTSDPWGTWDGATDEQSDDQVAEWKPDPADEAELVDLEGQLHGNADADESRVLRAKIELCRDRLRPPVEMVDNSGEATETHFDDDGNAIVDLPKPTPDQIDFRGELVGRLGLQDHYGPELGAQAEESFIRGGPLLLYLSDREFVRSLPDDVRINMIYDVEKSSPREAHEMARDLLKATTDAANDLEAAKERIFGDVESGAIHNAP